MGGVQFDAVVAGLGGAPDRGLEQVDDLGQLCGRHFGRRTSGQIRRDHRRAKGSDAVHLGTQPVGAGVHNLGLDLRAVLMDSVDQCAVRAHCLVGAEVKPARSLGV